MVAIVIGIADAAALSLLPAVGASMTFTVTSHSDTPDHHHGGSYGHGGFHGGQPGGGGSEDESGDYSSESEDFADFLHDQSGTLTLTRTSSGITVTTNGALDSFYSPLAITRQGRIDPGGPPERFIVAFDNAQALATGMDKQATPSGPWNATLNFLLGPDTLQALPVTVQTVSTNGDDVKLQGTGEGAFTISGPIGDQPVTVDVTVNAEIAQDRLSAYAQKVAQTMTMRGRPVTITTTTSLTAAATPSPLPTSAQ
jgi:hypothetical protein